MIIRIVQFLQSCCIWFAVCGSIQGSDGERGEQGPIGLPVSQIHMTFWPCLVTYSMIGLTWPKGVRRGVKEGVLAPLEKSNL